MNRLEINIGLFGAISSGKTTFLNAITGQQYSDTEIKKTTMVPQVYLETDNANPNPTIIRRKNREANESIMKLLDLNQFTFSHCQPIYHQLDRICDMFDPEIIDSNLKINIYDIPGLNDSASKNIYFQWVRENIKLFDIIIFMTDITKGLNNSDELEIVDLLVSSMVNTKTRMICLMNKCDDIYYDSEINDLVFVDNEEENIYIQANNILIDILKKYGMMNARENRVTAFIPISAENCFIYRALLKNPEIELDDVHINRICKSECGANKFKYMTTADKKTVIDYVIKNLENNYYQKIQDTGYLSVKNIIQQTIIDNKLDFLLFHLEDYGGKLLLSNLDDVHSYIANAKNYCQQLVMINNLKCNKKINISYDNLWIKVKLTINNYINTISRLDTRVIKFNDLVDLNDFDKLHATMQDHCLNFCTLVKALEEFPEYPSDSIQQNRNRIVNKLLNIYDQLLMVEWIDQSHIKPDNLKAYLDIIKIYAPDKTQYYLAKFLEMSTNPRCRNLCCYEKEMLNLIINNLNNNIVSLNIAKSLTQILINKILLMAEKTGDIYLEYLLALKNIIRNTCQNYLIDIISEIINKQITTSITSTSITNIYRQEIDVNKVKNIIDKYTPGQMFSIGFEIKLLDYISYANTCNSTDI